MGATQQHRLTGTSKPCIWMQAGVIRKKHCDSDYLCTACRFDRVMRQAADKNADLRKQGRTPEGARGKIVSWKEKLSERPPGKRPCLHHMKGRIEFRLCTNDYRCSNCEFDQYFYDQYTVHAVVKPIHAIEIDGFRIPHGFYLHRGHTWVKIEQGAMVRIGLDEFALRLLGPLDTITAPLMGKEVKRDRRDITLSRGARKASVRSPVTGVVADVNPRLRERGRVANDDPYADGWIFRIHAANLRTDLKHLMISSESGRFLEKEVNRLYQVMEETVPLAADGGQIGDDIFGNMPEVGWERLTRLFLRT